MAMNPIGYGTASGLPTERFFLQGKPLNLSCCDKGLFFSGICQITSLNMRSLMCDPLPLTVIIPTGNEILNLDDAVASVRWAGEILVVDSLSSDGTPERARELGLRVIQREYGNSASQKNWAIPQAQFPWVMILDADERVTPELAQEIIRFVRQPGQDRALRIYRLNHFMGRPIRHCGWQDDTVIRVFSRDHARYEDREVHADIIPDGPVRVAKGRLLHYTFRSFDQYMKKFDRYTSWAAGDRAKKTPRVGFIHLFGRPLARFIRQYFLKLGLLDGKAGFIICGLAAFSVFLKYAKLWERQQQAAASSLPAGSSADGGGQPQ
jgi:glycosyltransferase involved in cell wall biosynthesis